MSALEIDRGSTALVVIDLQHGIVSMQTEPHPAARVVAQAALLAEAFRRRSMPVFLVRVVVAPETALRPIADTVMPARGELPADWAEIVPELGLAPGDVVVTKRQWGAFYGTDLELRLRRAGIGTLVMAGISTTYGVQSTARAAYELGFQQVFAEDAMSDRARAAHESSIEFVLKRIGRVRTTAEILAALA
jgi:nicotinamidase-related amidase